MVSGVRDGDTPSPAPVPVVAASFNPDDLDEDFLPLSSRLFPYFDFFLGVGGLSQAQKGMNESTWGRNGPRMREWIEEKKRGMSDESTRGKHTEACLYMLQGGEGGRGKGKGEGDGGGV